MTSYPFKSFFQVLGKIHDLTKTEVRLATFLKGTIGGSRTSARISFPDLEKELALSPEALDQAVNGLIRKRILRPVKRLKDLQVIFFFNPVNTWLFRIEEEEERAILDVFKEQKRALPELELHELAKTKAAFASYKTFQTSIEPVEAARKRVNEMLESGKLVSEKQQVYTRDLRLWKEKVVFDKLKENPAWLDAIFEAIEKKTREDFRLSREEKEEKELLSIVESEKQPMGITAICMRAQSNRVFSEQKTPETSAYQVALRRIQSMLNEQKLELKKGGVVVSRAQLIHRETSDSMIAQPS